MITGNRIFAKEVFVLGISGTELVLILFFGFLIFGPEKLPQMGRTVGRAIRQFKAASEAANQKFKDEIYDPFKDAVQPYADKIQEQSAPLKDDIASINQTLNETKEMITDPFKTVTKSMDSLTIDTGRDMSSKPSITSMANDMLADPLGLKGDGSSRQRTDKSKAQTIPHTSGKVKKGLAQHLYGLDNDDFSATDAPAIKKDAATVDPFEEALNVSESTESAHSIESTKSSDAIEGVGSEAATDDKSSDAIEGVGSEAATDDNGTTQTTYVKDGD